MAAIKTLKRYLKQCDEVIDSDNRESARELQIQILAAFKNEFEGLSSGLIFPKVSFAGRDAHPYEVDYVGNIKVLKSRLQAELDKLEELAGTAVGRTDGKNAASERERIVFISHSSKDIAYVKEIVSLLEYIGLREGELVCSSIPDYGIPLGRDIYDWLREKFDSCDLHVLFVLSHNFYGSAASLNEMGAAWVLKQRYDCMLLPGFDFSDIKGAVNKDQIGIKLDGDTDEVKKRLGQLKDAIVSEYGLRPVPNMGWEKRRDAFIGHMKEIYETEKEKPEAGNMGRNGASVTVSSDACLLLLYAATDPYGQIIMLSTLGGLRISTGSVAFTNGGTAKEAARWQGALEELERYGLVRASSYKRQVFKLTREGFAAADQISDMHPEIDTGKDPKEYM